MEMDLDSLPSLVLCNIFQYLPLSSRNRIRLVSKKWNHACNSPIITRREVIVIYSTYWLLIADVFSTLTNSSRSIINLKFLEFGVYREISFFSENNESKSFWLDWGRKIGYLQFSGCHIEADTLSNILVRCTNLTGFHCSSVNCNFVDVLKTLERRNVILNEVTYLCLSDCFEGDVQEVLPNVFPNVRGLNIGFKNMVSGTCDCVLTMNKSSNLRHLELDYVSSPPENPSYLSEQKTLTEILNAVKGIKSLRLSRMNLTQHNIRQIRNLKNLLTLCLSANGASVSISVEILNHLPNLRHLEITDVHGFGPNIIVTPSVQTMIIRGRIADDENSIVVNECRYNDTLKTLCLDFDGQCVPENIHLYFIKYFRKLKNMCVVQKYAISSVMEEMRIHQRNLNSLTVTIEDNEIPLPDRELNIEARSEFFSFRQFEFLEHLQLVINMCLWRPYSFSNFVLPNCKYLSIKFGSAFTPDGYVNPLNIANLLWAVQKLPRIEHLRITDYFEEIPLDSVFRQVESHRNLRYLYFNHRPINVLTYSSSDYLKLSTLFEVRESLRFIHYQGISLFKNNVTKEISEVTLDSQLVCQLPLINDERISWAVNNSSTSPSWFLY